ncbi:hypothetical protein OAA19_03140 [Rubripirellula sp.]|nr:hypothetical protein [Rubripirellula sp.]
MRKEASQRWLVLVAVDSVARLMDRDADDELGQLASFHDQFGMSGQEERIDEVDESVHQSVSDFAEYL